jgi:hypothetical protein
MRAANIISIAASPAAATLLFFIRYLTINEGLEDIEYKLLYVYIYFIGCGLVSVSFSSHHEISIDIVLSDGGLCGVPILLVFLIMGPGFSSMFTSAFIFDAAFIFAASASWSLVFRTIIRTDIK